LEELDGEWLRWPGFIGDDYGHGVRVRVLGIGNMQRGFRSKRFGSVKPQRRHAPAHVTALDDAVRVTALRAAGAIGDLAYLDGIRPIHQFGLAGSWSVGDVFRAGLETVVPWAPEACSELPTRMPAAARSKRRWNCRTRPKSSSRYRVCAVPTTRQRSRCRARAARGPLLLSRGYLRLKGTKDPSTTLIYFSQRMRDRRLMADTTIGQQQFPSGTKKGTWTEALRNTRDGRSTPLALFRRKT
jgi:hypothetical protein